MLERILGETERRLEVPKDAFIFAASPPTAGKTTQAIFLVETTKARLIRGKDIVPELSHVLGTNRKLIPDATFLPILGETLDKLTASRVVLDNIPRTRAQAEIVKEWGKDNRVALHLIKLDLSEEEAVERVRERRICPRCGESYHPFLKPPTEVGICDRDRTRLIQKQGDDPNLARKGFRHNQQLEATILQVFEGVATIHQVPASGTVYDTARRLFTRLSPHIFYRGEMAGGYFKLRGVLDEQGFGHIFISGMPVFMYDGRALMKDFDILVPDDEIEPVAKILGLEVGVKDSSVAYTKFTDIAPGVEIVSNLCVKVGNMQVPFGFDFLMDESRAVRFMGLNCRIMGLEDLILFKAALGRFGPDDWGKHKDDLSDVEGLIGAQNVDWGKLLERSRLLGMEARLKEKVTSLGHEVKVGF